MNFLIHTGPGIGDILQKLPMASAIKEQYPDSNIDFIICGSPKNYEIDMQILECQKYVRNLYWYRFDYKFQCAKVLLQLRKNHYDFGFVKDGGMMTVSAKPSFWIFRIMRWGGVKKIVGFIRDYVDIYADVPEFANFIERDRLTLNAAGINAPMKLKTIDESKADFNFENCEKLRGKKIIAFSVGTNPCPWKNDDGTTIMYDVKSWSYKKWRELALRLAEKNIDVALIGGKQEQKAMSEKNITIPENPHIFNFVGKTSIKQSLALLSLCSLVVGSEGGMIHCASGLGIKTLIIFGGTDYRIWTPPQGEYISLNLDCSPCYTTKRAAECKYHRCLEEIDVETVFNRIVNMI